MFSRAAMVHQHLTSAAMTGRSFVWAARPIKRDEMLKKAGWVGAGLTLTALSTLASISLGAATAEAAVVYCKTVGVPKGCVVRPTPVVVAPVAAAAVVTPRVGVAGVGVGAPGVGVRAGTPMNRGGPVNRVGRR
jgi:hypothetical protein